jgi:prepilin-type N-terminal cleavage/methylation domain-containing protein
MARAQPIPPLFCGHGFTLLELIVVMAIFSVLMAIGVPTWIVLLPTYSLSSAARQVQSELHRIKMQAVAENVTFRLAFSNVADSYTIQRVGASTTQHGTKPLPGGIDVKRAITLGFTSLGTASPGGGGTVRLCNSQGVGTNVVLNSTGRVRVCRTSACDGTC